jgi:hypothetical protein
VENPVALTKVKRTLLEAHHIAGAANDASLVAVVCRNHHTMLTEAQLGSGVELRHDGERASLERLAAVLSGLADFFELLTACLRAWAAEVLHTVALLDRDYPDWRNLA